MQSNGFGEISLEKFIGSSICDKIKIAFRSDRNNSIKIFACDARVFYLLSKRSKHIYNAYINCTYVLPDGRPIYWLLKNLGVQNIDHFTGPELMRFVLSDPELKKFRHMFYGGSSKTSARLREMCLTNEVNVVDVHSPPFLSIDNLEIEDVKRRLKEYQPDFFWCGLGAPKQEFLINEIEGDRGIIFIGVGLGFDYYTGAVKKPPTVVSSFGLEWLIRYIQQPTRVRRFVRPFFYMSSMLLVSLIRLALQRLNRLY